MEETLKRKERLQAMRTQASEAEAEAAAAKDSGQGQFQQQSQIIPGPLMNPLNNDSVSTPSSSSRNTSFSSSGFDYYTDPLAAFSNSSNSKRGKRMTLPPETSPQTSSSSSAATSRHSPHSGAYSTPRNSGPFGSPSPQNHYHYQQRHFHGGLGVPNFNPMTSPQMRSPNFMQPAPRFSPETPNFRVAAPWMNHPMVGSEIRPGFRSPVPRFPGAEINPSFSPQQFQQRQGRGTWSPGNQQQPFFNPRFGKGSRFSEHGSENLDYGIRSPGGSHKLQERDKPESPVIVKVSESLSPSLSPCGRGRGRGRTWSDPRRGGINFGGFSPGSGAGSSQKGGKHHVHVSARERPDLFVKKSMVEDPWKNLVPVVVDCRSKLAQVLKKNSSSGKNTSGPSNVRENFDVGPSLADSLALSLEDAVNETV